MDSGKAVPYIIDNWTFNAVGYEARKGSPAEITVNWEIFHGSMEPGNYRIIKTVNDFREQGIILHITSRRNLRLGSGEPSS